MTALERTVRTLVLVVFAFSIAEATSASSFRQQVRVHGNGDPSWPEEVTAVALLPDGQVAVATPQGTFLSTPGTFKVTLHNTVPVAPSPPAELDPAARLAFETVLPMAALDDSTSFLAHDRAGRTWLASRNGLAVYEPETYAARLWRGADGLPWNEFTAIAAAPDGTMWFGTTRGLIHFDLDTLTWEYRQGPRWLPGDHVTSLVVDGEGSVWAATDGGLGLIRHVPMTLAQKAAHFNDQIEAFHKRTPYGYVDAVTVPAPGDLTRPELIEQHSSDNDGLWTSMYGAAQCFATAATGDPKAEERAHRAFEALRFLGTVTQGGSHPAPPGFVARSILPTSGRDPNPGRVETDRRKRVEDRLWKSITPRWPIDESGRWYWKTDTSSDELDGHYFFYALYYDLVAKSEAERAAVRGVVTSITDHLLAHDGSLVDHDGKQTRWAVFGPDDLNLDKNWWGERGLNSLSFLSYLRVAEHMSGDPAYGAAAEELMEKHGYAANARVPKIHLGPGTGNHSDDEMGFMSLYGLLRYERDPELRQLWAHTLHRYWLLEQRERNPLFDLMYAALIEGEVYEDAFERGTLLNPEHDPVAAALDSLERYPLDRFDWPLRNSHRLDIQPLYDLERGAWSPQRGFMRGRHAEGRVLPIDERFVGHWNHDPWRLDYNGSGRRLADGASFLLPYYLGLYHRLIEPTL